MARQEIRPLTQVVRRGEHREQVFVYGTLRSGGSNHFRMAAGELIASGSVRGRLYRIDWYPGLVLDAAGDEIRGEVFGVGAELLAALDDYEGGEYRRVRVRVTAESGEAIDVWAWEWTGQCDEKQRITGGDWLREPGI